MPKIYKKLLAIFVAIGSFFVIASGAHAATYTINKTADVNDGTCDSDCSLREAIAAANANAGHDTINFNIPESDSGFTAPAGDTQGYFTISFGSTAQHQFTDSAGAFINGYSQPGAQRNTAFFGETANTLLKIQLSWTTSSQTVSFTGDNHHVAGINFAGVRTMTFSGSNNWFEGNFYGTDITGANTTVKPGTNGITFATGGTNNIVGTNGDGAGDAGERNVLQKSSNSQSMIVANSSDTVIAGNYFGTNKTGRVCGTGIMGRSHVNGSAGSHNMRIGTNMDGVSDKEESNIFACINVEARPTIRIGGDNGLMQGNYIGTNPHGDDLQSFFAQRAGIGNDAVATNWVIKNNVIAHNTEAGIYFRDNATTGNTISQNSIYSTDGLGIDISEPTGWYVPFVNDIGDVDTGINDLMNYPVIKKAGISGNKLLVTADLDFNPTEASFTLEFFNNSELHSSGHGPGETYLGSATTSQTGSNVTLSVSLSAPLPTDISKLTATATNSNGSTSEFSAAPLEIVEYLDPISHQQPNLASTGDNHLALISVVLSVLGFSVFTIFYTMRNGSVL